MAPELAPASVKPAVRPARPAGRACVTFLAGNGDYLKGVVGLAKGLRKVRSAYPLLVGVVPDVPQKHRRELEGAGGAGLRGPGDRAGLPAREPDPIRHGVLCYQLFQATHLGVLQFVEYSKMICLDGDILKYDNIDHLFDLPEGHFYAVMDCYCEKTWSHTPQYKIGYCQQCPDKVQWPEAELGPRPPPYFNVGMFVFEPGVETYEDLLRTAKITPPIPFAEQDFLNMYFREIYNLVLAMFWRHPENVELEKVRVVHYCAAGSKPWRYTGREDNMRRGGHQDAGEEVVGHLQR